MDVQCHTVLYRAVQCTVVALLYRTLQFCTGCTVLYGELPYNGEGQRSEACHIRPTAPNSQHIPLLLGYTPRILNSAIARIYPHILDSAIARKHPPDT